MPKSPTAAVLVLHGGGARRKGMRVSPNQLSVLRMIPIAERLARAGEGKIAVYRLLNSARGWDTSHTPVEDVRWALEQMRAELPPDTPVGLVGHSLGGRAALLAAGEDGVESVVALAPWVEVQDGNVDGAGREVLIVHGTADRIADPRRSAAVADRLRRTAKVAYVRVVGGKHAMLSRHETFSSLATQFMLSTLLDNRPEDPDDILSRARTASGVDV
ncbi:MAG: alpha/beta fold hydrolase [Antricoccus sp.]